MMHALYLAGDEGWSAARTADAFAARRDSALDRRPDGSFRLEDDPSTYRVARFWSQRALSFVFGVYRDEDGTGPDAPKEV